MTLRSRSNRAIGALAALTVFLALPSVGAAQGADPAQAEPPARFHTEIVVTPERGETPRMQIPASTVVIDVTALPALPAMHPAEIISLLPGFQVAQAPFHAGRPVVAARGFFGGGEAEYVRLLVDGVPAADAESGLIDWSLVPVSSIRRVEALRGPGASLYGDAAIGGVIQFFTDRDAAGGQLTVAAGSFDTLSADGWYGRRAGGVRFNVSGAARRTDGGFAHSAGRQYSAGGSLDGAWRGLTWRWNASGDDWTRDDPGWLGVAALQADPQSSDPLYRLDTVDRHTVTTAFTLHGANTAWQPLARVYASTRDDDSIRTVPLIPGVGDTQARALSSGAIGGSVEAGRTFVTARPATVRLGLDLAREHVDTSYRSVSGSGALGTLDSGVAGDRHRAGLFASASWDAMPRVRLSAGTRLDIVDDSGFAVSSVPRQDAWSPRAGIVVQLTGSGAVTAYAQASMAFKAPTLDQRFDPRPYPDFRGGTLTISNRALLPQRARGIEAGVSHTGAGARWSALVYSMGVTDEIDFDLRTFSYANIGRSRHTGIEVEGEKRWAHVRPAISYALTRVTEPASNLQLKNIPRHLIVASADVNLPWAFGVYARCQRSWHAFLDDGNLFAIDGPATCDARVRRPLGRHVLFLDVMNITNDVYEEYGLTLTDLRGRTVPFARPGAPRAIRGGVTLSF